MTPLAAATATTQDGPLWPALLLVGALALAYAGACWLRPFARCTWCTGRGCRWCRHTGQRLRLGRRIANHATRLRRAAGAGTEP